MKKNYLNLIRQIVAFFLSVFFGLQAIAAENGKFEKSLYSYTPDGKVEYKLSHQKILVKFKSNVSIEQQAGIVSKFKNLKAFDKSMALPSPKVSILEFSDEFISEEKIFQLLEQLNSLNEIEYANPFLVFDDGTLQGIQNRVAVKLKNESDLTLLQRDASKLGLSIISNYEYDKNLYFLETSKNSPGNALTIANLLAESGKYNYSEPDFLLLLKKFSTNDTFLGHQWSLNNTGSSIQFNGTPGCDMKVFNAWLTSTGSSNIRIAIIDEGVDLVHPDLLANMLPGFDGTQQNSGGAPQGNDAHGTACAGIVAAVANNNLGVAGIAYNSKIVPVRIAYSSGSSWVTSNSWIGTSLDWAWNQGAADVLSNSWGGGSSSSLINDPIGRAVTQGRGGKGAPVLFAAGNNNGAVSYPATLSNVISVVAMSMCNQRKNPSSCDGENWWGSNFGTNADVSAPGVKIYTTDISGSAGYSTGNYAPTFNGTSSACPNAAGVMALILSVNPNLTMTQARQILESTCDKVGGYTYNSNVSGQPNGTWSTDLGYGRVNAQAALQLANPTPCTNPPAVATTNASPANICSPSNITLTLSGINMGTGQTYQWQSSSNNITYSNISGATSSSFTANNVSATTWFRCLVTCGATTASSPVQVLFNNPLITTFPHTQNFDASSALPCGWSVQNVNNDARTWSIGTTNSRSAPNNVTYTYNTAAAANDWLFSAPLQLNGGSSYRVRFWFRARSASYPERLEVKWGNTASEAGMTSAAIFSNTNITNTAYLEGITTAINPSTTGTYYVGFRIFSNADMWDLNLDDVTIELTSSCVTPLLGGTISGPLNSTAGETNNYSLTGNTGNTIQWQQSIDNGTTWTDIAGGNTSSLSMNFNPGNIRLRARSSQTGSTCPEVFSNVLNISVSPRLGDNINIPINAILPFTTSNSNATGSGYTSTYTGTNQQVSPDIFYSFTTSACSDSIRISACASNFDTYIHLLNASGGLILSNDDNGPYCTGTRSSIKASVLPNTTYILVVEGYTSSTGNIQLEISEIDNPTLSPVISTSGPTTFCSGENVTLSLSGYSVVLWSNGSTSNEITINQSGNYFATVTNAAGCSAQSNTVSVTVNPNPTVSISPAGTSTICELSSQTFTSSGASTYLWSNGSISNNINVNSAGVYSVIGTDANGCTGTTFVTLNTVAASTYYADADNDGFGNALNSISSCSLPLGYVSNNTDCNDNDASVNAAQSYFVDSDGDGFGSTQTAMLCSSVAPSGYSTNNTDCNDNDASVNAPQSYFVDSDGDGFGSTQTAMLCSSVAPSGYSTNNTDCNDNDASVNAAQSYFVDSDGDGFGSTQTAMLCSSVAPSGYSTNNTDCNDNDETTFPGATEVCGNGIDDDCDGQTDEGCCNIQLNISKTDANCTDINNGSALVNINNAISPVSISWSNGETSSSISGLAVGSYTVTVTDANNCTQTATVEIVNAGIVPGAPTAINGASGVCRNSVNNVFSITPVEGATSYIWTLPAGASGSSTTNSISVNINGSYVTGNICVRAINACGQSVNFCRPLTYFSSAPAQPGVISGTVQGVCANSIQTYSIANVNNATSYTWTVPTTATILSGQGSNTIQVQFGSSWGTSGTISVRAVNCRGNSSSRSLTIFNIPGTPSTISGLSVGVCGGSIQNYSVTNSAAASTYLWTVPAGVQILAGQGTNAIQVQIPTGFISGTLSVVAQSACGQSAARTLSIRSIPAQPGNITGPANNVCGSSTFTYSIAAVAGATSYTWTVPNNCTIVANNGTSISLTVNSSFTSGSLCVSANNACGIGTSRCLTINRLPATPVSVSGVNAVCSGSTQTYTTAQVGSLTYNWTVPSGATIISGQGTNSISVLFGTSSGNVGVRAVNACGQSGARNFAVTVSACRIGETAAEETETTNSETFDLIENNDRFNFEAYPNPFDASINIIFNSENSETADIRLFDVTGRIIFIEQIVSGANYQFSPDVKQGVYFIELIENSGNRYTKKVIKN